MLTDRTSTGANGSEHNGDMVNELVKTLESAGFTGEKLNEAMAQLREHPIEQLANGNGHENGHSNGHTTAPAAQAEDGVEAEIEPDLTDNARIILEKRYLQRDEEGNPKETPEQLFHRVANAIAEGETEAADKKLWSSRFYNLMASLKFLPNSPTLVNAGTGGRGCLSACFVVSPEDDMNSIMDVAHDAALIEKWGGGIGFGFSKLRPRKDKIATTHGEACGPIAVMKLYSSVGAALTQGAFRLGAHMGQLRIDHPDIQEFIHCKDNDDTLQNFNISVQITDEFMRAVEADADWALINPRDTGNGPSNEVYTTVRARELWQEICESAHKTGDPGVVFIDRVWETAPNPQMGRIETSNPCGEEFLENYGNCCLGSINLDKHIIDDPSTKSGRNFDWDELEKTVRTSVRFLNDVIEVNQFPLPKLREVNLKTRRIGLGVMGWADALVRMGIPYDSDEAIELGDRLGKFINETAWSESANVAKERGPFSEYENSRLKEIGMPPVRNASVITIAPTGTISRLAGCSSGIEPNFAIAWWSNVLWKDHAGSNTRLLDAPTSVRETLEQQLGSKAQADEVLEQIANSPEANSAENILNAYGVDPALFRTSMAISAEAHVNMQAIWQKHVTNSVSKTINLPNSATIQDVMDAYQLAWETKCKAVTVYRDGSKSMQVLETGKKARQEPSARSEAVAEPEVYSKEHTHLIVPRQRPNTVRGVTERVRTGHGTMFVTVNFDEEAHPFEVFTTLGKSGGCHAADLEAISRLISLALRSGIDPDEIVSQLKGITCCPVWDNGSLVRSDADALSLALGRHLSGEAGMSAISVDRSQQLGLFPSSQSDEQNALPTGARCPKCSGYLIPQEGCLNCLDCGYSKCE